MMYKIVTFLMIIGMAAGKCSFYLSDAWNCG